MHINQPTTILYSLLLAASLAACSGGHADHSSAEPSGGAAAPEGASDHGTLTIRGSDTMVILAQRWAEAFMASNPGATVQVSGGGSGTGIAALINGTTDLADASRTMKDRERAQVQSARHAAAHETRVALDALAIYVNADNPIASLSFAQLKRLYRGQVSNWHEVGGPDRPVILYGRENSSGTYAYLKEHVLDEEDFAPQTQTLPGTAAVIHAVSRDPGGIGYGGIAYAEGVRVIQVSGEEGPPIEPTMQNATNGTYPLSRFLNIYSAGVPTGLAGRYIDFVLSPAGQGIIENVGYYPLPDDPS